MSTIIAGHFEQQSQVEHVTAALIQAGFSEDHISSFYLNPPGQHDLYPIGGDRDASPGAEKSDEGAATGMTAGGAIGVAAGIASAPFLGPVGVATGALVGAHIGSLVGTLSNMKDAEETERPARKAGMMVAVCLPASDKEASAIEVLRAQGAASIERANGTIVNGNWDDFDPLGQPVLL